MSNENTREFENSLNLDDDNEQLQQISMIEDVNQQAIVPANPVSLIENLQYRLIPRDCTSTPATINFSLNVGKI